MRVFARLINFLATISISVGYLWFIFRNDCFNQNVMTHYNQQVENILIAVAIAIIILNIYCIMRHFSAMRKRQRAIEVSTDGGLSSVSIDAVQRSLSSVLAGEEDVRHPKMNLTVTAKGKPLNCVVEFGLRRTRDITGRADELKHMVREAFLRMIPGGPGINIVTNVIDIENENSNNASTDSSYFSGPVYPDNDDANSED